MTTDAGSGKPGRRDPNRRVIDITCTTHRGARGYTPLVCTKRDDLIQLDPHAIGCVLVLDEDAAIQLRDVLIEWLG
ncbi:MAG TPA: hypothetical protein VGL46_04015 [Pseudonocardiaceae bacterium]|jgi:hypothetical protein